MNFKQSIRNHALREHLKTNKRIAFSGVPSILFHLFSSGTKVVSDEIASAKRVYEKYSGEKKQDHALLLDVAIVRSSCTRTKASIAKLGVLTDSLGSMLYSLEVINSSPIETHSPSSGTSLFSSSLKAKIIATSARVEALGLDFDKTAIDFYEATASVSKKKSEKKS